MEDKIEVTEAGKTRRAFVKTAAQVAVTAPAVAMLLTASTKKASAITLYSAGDNFVTSGDDFGGDAILGDDAVTVP